MAAFEECGVVADAAQRRLLPTHAFAGLADVIQVEQRSIPFGVRLMCINPASHIIALVTTKNDLIVYNSASWSQIFRKYTCPDGFEATSMAWRFDSRLLAVGYLNGRIGLADVEDGKEVYKLAFTGETEEELNSAVALLAWLPSGGWSKQDGGCEPRNHLNPYALRLHDLHDAAIPLPKQTNAGGGTSAMLADKAKTEFLNSEAKLFNQTRLSFLAAWYHPSRIVLYAYGLYAVLNLDFHSPSLRWTLRSADCISHSTSGARVRMPLAMAMSADHRDFMLSFVVGTNDSSSATAENSAQNDEVIQNTSIDTSILYYGFYELEAITFRLCKIDAYFEFVEKTLAQIDESCVFVSDDGLEFKLRSFLRNRQSRIADFHSEYDKCLAGNTLDILLTDLVELLTVGMMDEELEMLVRTALTPDAVRRLAANLDRAYTKLRDLCVVHLLPALEAVMLLFDELRMFNCMPQKFRAILGGSAAVDKSTVCSSLFQTSASLLLKAKEFVCVIDQCVINMRAFFEWVFVDLDLLIAMPDSEVGHAWGFRGGMRHQLQTRSSHGPSSAGATVSSRSQAARSHTGYAQENEGRAVGGSSLGFAGAYAGGQNAAGTGGSVRNEPSGNATSSLAEEVRLHRLASNTNLSLGVGIGGINDTVTCVLEFIRDTFSQQVLLHNTDDPSEYGGSGGKTLRLERVSQYLRDAPLNKCYPYCTATVAADAAQKPNEYDLYTPGVWSTAGVSVHDDAAANDADNKIDDINEFSRRFVDFSDELPMDRALKLIERNCRRHVPLQHTLYRVERTKSLKQLFVQLRRHTKTILLPAISRNVSARIAINGTFPLIKLSDADGSATLSSPSGTVVLPRSGGAGDTSSGAAAAAFVPRLQLSCYGRFLPHAVTADASESPGNKFITAIQLTSSCAEKLRKPRKSTVTAGDAAHIINAAVVSRDDSFPADGSAGMLMIVRHDITHSTSSTLDVLRDAHFMLDSNDDLDFLNLAGRKKGSEQRGEDAGLKLCSLLPAPSTNKVQHRIVLADITLPSSLPRPVRVQQVGEKTFAMRSDSTPMPRCISTLNSFTYLHLTDQLMLLIHTGNSGGNLAKTFGHNNNSLDTVGAASLYYMSLPQIFSDHRTSSAKPKISSERYPSATLFDFATTNKTAMTSGISAADGAISGESGDKVDAVVHAGAADESSAADDLIQPRRLRFADNMDVADGSADDELYMTIKLAHAVSPSASVATGMKTPANCVPGAHWNTIQVVNMQKMAILFRPCTSRAINNANRNQSSNSIALVCLQPSVRARRAAEMSLHNNNSTTSWTSVAGESDLYCCERVGSGNGAGRLMETISKPLPVCSSHDEMLQASTQSLFADLCLPQRFKYDASLAQRARRFAAGVVRAAATTTRQRKKRRDGNEQPSAERNQDDEEIEGDKFDGGDPHESANDEDDGADEQVIASILAQLEASSSVGDGRVQRPDDIRWLSDDFAPVVQSNSNISDADDDDSEDEDWASFILNRSSMTAASVSEVRPQRSKLAPAPHRAAQRGGNTPFSKIASSSAFINSTLHKPPHSTALSGSNTTNFLRDLQSRVDQLASHVAGESLQREPPHVRH